MLILILMLCWCLFWCLCLCLCWCLFLFWFNFQLWRLVHRPWHCHHCSNQDVAENGIFFSYFLLKYKRAASYIDVEVNMDLFLFKVGIAGDFVANGNMIFPSQSRFLRRLMVRADQRLLFFSGFSHFLKSFFPPFTTFLLIFLICPTDTLAKAGTRLVLHCSQKPLSRSAISQGGWEERW